MIDLTAEANSTESYFVNYRELLAINGTLLIAELSAPLFYPIYWTDYLPFSSQRRSNPAFLVGIPTRRLESSFRMSVESGADVKAEDVFAVRESIERVQRATVAAVQ